MPTDSDYLTAKAYLRFLRSPESFIESVDEVSRMTGSEIERSITLVLRAGESSESTLIDIQHPLKGTISDSRHEGNGATVEIINHDDHLAISQYLVWFRFMTVWRTVRAPRRSSAAFSAAMLDVQEKLMSIPTLNPERAKEVLDECFVGNSSVLAPLLLIPGVRIDALKLDRLRGLCVRLSERYLLLLRATPIPGVQTPITFTQRQEVSEYAERRRKKDKVDRARPAARHLVYGTVPIAFRMHMPWAKRTDHYSLRIDPPSGHFFYPQTILTRDARGDAVPIESSGSETRWSIQTLGGRHNATFVSHGTSFPGPLYLSLRTLEIPGRATSKACVMALLVTLGLFGFLFLETASRDLVIQVGTLVLPLLAIGAFATAPGPGHGILGVPLLARVTAPLLAIDCVLFFFYYGLGLALLPVDKKPESFLLTSPTWYGVIDLLFPLLAACLAVLLGLRLDRLYRTFKASSARNHVFSTDFFRS